MLRRSFNGSVNLTSTIKANHQFRLEQTTLYEFAVVKVE